MSLPNAIKIYSDNFVDENDDYSFISGSALEAYLYDQKQDTKWISTSSNDTVEEIIEISFKNWQGTEITRTFDTIIILNTNAKAMACDYWNGSDWVAISEASITNSAANVLIDIVTSISATKFRIKITTTIVANAEKYIGELKVCNNIIDGSQEWLSEFSREDEQRADNYRLTGGALVAWKEWTKCAGSLDLSNVNKTNKDLLLPYLKIANFIIVAFYSDYDMTEIYEFSIVNEPNYTFDRKTQLFEISLDLQEK